MKKKVICPDWPVGTSVKMVGSAEADLEKYKDKVFTTRSETYEMCGSSVVMLKGFSGCYATEFLQVVKEGGRDE